VCEEEGGRRLVLGVLQGCERKREERGILTVMSWEE